MKFCRDCKWVEGSGENALCNAPRNMTGAPGGRKWTYCSTHRDGSYLGAYIIGACGPQARWFEPRSEEQLAWDKRKQEIKS